MGHDTDREHGPTGLSCWGAKQRRPFVGAVVFWAGCAIGTAWHPGTADAWSLAGALALISLYWCWRRDSNPVMESIGWAAMAIAILCSSIGWAIVRDASLRQVLNDRYTETQGGVYVEVEGRVSESVEFKRTPVQPLLAARGDANRDSAVFSLSVDRVNGEDLGGLCAPWGTVSVWTGPDVIDLRVGEQVRVRGLFEAISRPLNPGEFDRAAHARRNGIAGRVRAAGRESIEKLNDADGLPLRWRMRRFRYEIRQRACSWLLTGLSIRSGTDWLEVAQDDGEESRALLAALLLGDRSTSLRSLEQSFRRTGLVHLLTISGAHLAIFVGLIVCLARLLNVSPQYERVAVVSLVSSYLLILPVEAPLVRAGLMVGVYAVSGLAGRRVDPLSVVGVTAIFVLLWMPWEAITASFQLTYGIVIGMMTLTRQVRIAMFGSKTDFELLSRPRQVIEMIKTATASSIAAWIWATPLTAFHFGSAATLVAPLSVILAPVVALLLTLGYLKCLVTAIFPALAGAAGSVVLTVTDCFIWTVEAADGIPWASVRVPFPGLTWVILVIGFLLFVTTIEESRSRLQIWTWRVCGLLLLLWLLRGHVPGSSALVSGLRRDDGRITMLAVGNGSCYLLESQGRTAVFDCGSGTNSLAGSTIISPSLHRLGVLRVNDLIISHADMDHYNAAAEVISVCTVDRLVVNSPLLATAGRMPGAGVAHLIDFARAAGIQLVVADAGHSTTIGRMRLDWLAPPPLPPARLAAGGRPLTDNELGAVIRVSINGRRLLLTGDTQREGMHRLLNLPGDSLRSDILELPHHGSWDESAAELVSRVNPRIVLQSTAIGRLVADRWAVPLAGMDRYVTARDGAVTILINTLGEIHVETWADTTH